MSTSLSVDAHIRLSEHIGERDENGRLKHWMIVPKVRITNEDTNESVKYYRVSEIVCPLIDIQLFNDGTRDWVLTALNWSRADDCNCVTHEDVEGLINLCRQVCKDEFTDYRSFIQTLEGHPDVECDEDEDGQLFAGVCQTAEEILTRFEDDNFENADWIEIGTY